LSRSYNIFKDDASGEYYFDYVSFPEGVDPSTFKFYRVEAKSVAEVEAAFRTIVFGAEAATAGNAGNKGNANNTASVAATVGEDEEREEEGNGGAPSDFSGSVAGLSAATSARPGLRAAPLTFTRNATESPSGDSVRPPPTPTSSAAAASANGTAARRVVVEENNNNNWNAAVEAEEPSRPAARPTTNLEALNGGKRRTRKAKRAN
jgi:hypothetical protein